ncbi:MAG: ankyrin repeat domain-containing protein [Pirellulales bacterium]|nr:ankyrin repeat domain-containing protein [Pirellulales bacterium]
MRKYTVKREDQVLGEFSAEQIRQQKDAGKRIGFLFKCAAVSVLVAILTFWLSESAFRPPTVEYESGGEWQGLGNVLNGESRSSRNGGPVYAIVRWLYDGFGIGRYRNDPYDDTALGMWIVLCMPIGILVGLFWAKAWLKQSKKKQTFDVPFVSPKMRIGMIYAAVLMGVLISAFEFRNTTRRSLREANIALIEATKNADFEAVKEALDNGADANAVYKREAAVNFAIKSGNIDFVKLLIEEGADLTHERFAPLPSAVSSGNLEMFKLVATELKDTDAVDEEAKATSLHSAAGQGYKEIAEHLIANGANVNWKSRGGTAPLHEAAGGGHKEIVELLIASGVDVSVTGNDYNGWPPLLYAAKNGHKEVVELLIAKGANINAKNKRGESMLGEVIDNMQFDTSDRLIQKIETAVLLVQNGAADEAKDQYLRQAVDDLPYDEYRKELIEALVLRGAGVSHEDRYGETILHEAAQGTRHGKELAQTLIKLGTNVNLKDKKGLTPLHHAVDGEREIVEALVKVGADVNAKTPNGRTPLAMALLNDEPEIAALLREHGAKSGAEDSIHIAAMVGDTEAVKKHLSDGRDINARDRYGRTPLHDAAYNGRAEVAKLIIDNGADVNAKDRQGGNTPMNLAVRAEQTKIINLLRSNGGKTRKQLRTPSRPTRTARTARTRPPARSQKNARPKSFPTTTQEVMFGDNPTLTDNDKALWVAAKEGDSAKVKQLLDKGVDINIYGSTVGVDFGCTALFWAAANNHIDTVDLLIEKGAYIDAGAGIGGSPLARAAYEGHVEIVELLIEHGANVNAKDGTGRSVLDAADDSVAPILQRHGAVKQR